MPYSELDRLPKGIKDNLPPHAQEIYMSAYNNAIEQYSDQQDSESTAHRVAWSAVKQQYEKSPSGNWHKK